MYRLGDREVVVYFYLCVFVRECSCRVVPKREAADRVLRISINIDISSMEKKRKRETGESTKRRGGGGRKRDGSTKKRGKRAQNDVQYASKLPKMAIPMNQGRSGTCASYAFATAVAQSIMGKYGVVLDRKEIKASLLAHSGNYDGADPLNTLHDWNKSCSKLRIPDIDSGKWYKIKIKEKCRS